MYGKNQNLSITKEQVLDAIQHVEDYGDWYDAYEKLNKILFYYGQA
jgi:hypothetical protein